MANLHTEIRVGVGGIVLNEENKVFVALRSKQARIEPGKWEFPGGELEFGENVEDALRREFFEEHDINIKIQELLQVYSFILKNCSQQWIGVHFLCKIISGQPTIKEPDKCEDWGWFQLSDVEKLTLTEPSSALLQKYLNFLLEKGDDNILDSQIKKQLKVSPRGKAGSP
jgi:mutator protein MutT